MLTLGILAMIGTVGTAVSDVILMGHASSGSAFRQEPLENVRHVSPRRMFWGHTLGVLIIPLMGFGIWQMYLGLEPAGFWHALPPVAIMGYTLVVGAASHACFAHLGTALRLRDQQENNSPPDLDLMVTQFRRLLHPIFGMFWLGMAVSSFWFGFVVWTQETMYPHWMAFVNPIALHVVMGVLANSLPAPIGGYVFAASGNFGMFTFFLVSTVVLTS